MAGREILELKGGGFQQAMFDDAGDKIILDVGRLTF
jgi:hypothetical protein